jgi:hypothetical protein
MVKPRNGLCLSGCIALILAGCSRQPSCHTVRVNSFGGARYAIRSKQGNGVQSPSQIYQTKLADVPFPLGSTPVEQFDGCVPTDQGMIVAFVSPLALPEVATYFAAEMEREGWRTVAHLDGPEAVLMFEKPRRLCSISLRPAEDLTLKRMSTLMVVAVMAR